MKKFFKSEDMLPTVSAEESEDTGPKKKTSRKDKRMSLSTFADFGKSGDKKRPISFQAPPIE